ncbi:MAG TPA: PEP-CTERM sorting domain-containing protein [Caulobacteraceae bacterium]|nr:PEP-CTERM sorting domain-containing protein [Caulobacteraceae bacterium]
MKRFTIRRSWGVGAISGPMVSTLGALAVLLPLAPSHAAPPPPPPPMPMNVDFTGPVGVPMGSATMANPWIIDFTQPPAMAGGMPVITRVTVNNLPAIMAGETPLQASRRKANTLAAAVNMQLGRGRATVTPVRVGRRTVGYTITITGLYTIPPTPARRGMPAVPGTPAYTQITNPTREFGDGGALRPGAGGGGSGGGSSGGSYGGSMGGSMSALPATGMDPTGAPSMVTFGVNGVAVATVDPYAGETDAMVLQQLGTDLSGLGLPTTFDATNDLLSINNPISDSATLDWGNTDTGLDFDVALTGGTAVPEPAAWLMILVGVGLLGARLRARQARPTCRQLADS